MAQKNIGLSPRKGLVKDWFKALKNALTNVELGGKYMYSFIDLEDTRSVFGVCCLQENSIGLLKQGGERSAGRCII